MQRTTYSVSDSVNSTGFSEDLNSGPSAANSGMAASCSEGRGRGGEGRQSEVHDYSIVVEAHTLYVHMQVKPIYSGHLSGQGKSPV